MSSTVHHPKAGLIETELPGELILLDPETQEMFSLNETGILLWRMLPATADRLASRLSDDFDVTPAQAESDVRALLHALSEAGLLQEEDGAPGE